MIFQGRNMHDSHAAHVITIINARKEPVKTCTQMQFNRITSTQNMFQDTVNWKSANWYGRILLSHSFHVHSNWPTIWNPSPISLHIALLHSIASAIGGLNPNCNVWWFSMYKSLRIRATPPYSRIDGQNIPSPGHRIGSGKSFSSRTYKRIRRDRE